MSLLQSTYPHLSDEVLFDYKQTTYVRYCILLEQALLEQQKRVRREFEQSTFIGYQYYLMQPMPKNQKPKSFKEYFEMFFEGEQKVELATSEQILLEAESTEQAILEMFANGDFVKA